MKTHYARLLAIAGLAFTISACAASRTHEAAGEYVDDSAVTAKIKTKLIADPATEAHHIDVVTYRGIVQLSGFVESPNERNVAERLAFGVPGVKAVHDNLQVRASDRSAGQMLDDGVITTRVKTALIENPITKAHQISVATSNGTVQLSGFVDSVREITEASKVAQSVPGVRVVQNEIETKPVS